MYSAFSASTPPFLLNVLYVSVSSAPLHSIYVLAPPFFCVSAGTYQLFHVSALVLTLLRIRAPDLLCISASASISIPVLRISTASLLFCVLAISHTRYVSALFHISSCNDFSMYQRRTSTHYRASTQRRTSALLHISHSRYKVGISSFIY